MSSFSTKTAIFTTIALDLIGLTIIFPLLPIFETQFGASTLWIGIMGWAYALCSFVASPLLGRLSDRIGRKKILTISVFGSAVGWIITAFAPNFWWVLVGRVIDWITAGNMTIAQAILSDISKDEKERAKYYGVFGMMFGLAFIVGPFLWGFLVQWGYAVPFLVTGCISFVNALFITFFLPETHTPNKLLAFVKKSSFPVFGALKSGHMALYLWVALLVGLGAGVYRNSYSLYMDKFYHLSIRDISHVLMWVGVFMAFCQGFLLWKFWLKKFSPRQILTITLTASTILFTSTAIYDQFGTRNIFIWLAFEVTMVFFTIAMWPVLQSEWVSKASSDTRGEVSGYFSSVFSMTAIIAPIVGGYMINHMISPMWIAGIFSAFAFILFWYKREEF
jgi:DHA1 family tetracycline resistance protein-like MFS transporter